MSSFPLILNGSNRMANEQFSAAASPPHSVADEGDRTARFLRLLGKHEDDLKAFIFVLVPRWSDADDIAQEVRIKLWEQFDKYDSQKDFGTWARTIAYWQVLTWRKTAQRRPALLGERFLELVAEEVEERASEAESRRNALTACLGKLEPAKRELIETYYRNEVSARELSERWGQSFHAIRHTLQRTRLILADCIEKTLRQSDAPKTSERQS